MNQTLVKEGDIYQTISVGGKLFVIYYGFYSDKDRKTENPIPIFPDFTLTPQFSECGKPFVTKIQDACQYYASLLGERGEGWCCDCKYFENPNCDISLCTNPRCFKKNIYKSSDD